jgi:soluble lytic murein transglycosylase-like protein
MKGRRPLVHGAALVAVLIAAAPAAADEAMARRLAALKALVDPQAARLADAPASSPASGCPSELWWRMTGYGVRSRIDTAVRDASIRFVVDARLIRSVIEQESNYQIDAVSHKGAMGLMQLMPRTARELGVVCPFDPRENILGGTRYLRRLRDRFGSWPEAVAAYHAGPRRVTSRRIPHSTRRYVHRVIGGWRPHELAWMELD